MRRGPFWSCRARSTRPDRYGTREIRHLDSDELLGRIVRMDGTGAWGWETGYSLEIMGHYQDTYRLLRYALNEARNQITERELA